MFVFDDQLRLNYALQAMDPDWEDTSREDAITHDNPKRGTTATGFTVTLLPEDIICRSNCSKELQSHYHVWHSYTQGKALKHKTANLE